ncbi:hypothetical protein TNCV_1283271 [Trichonephila clavipes]|uniref:Uncharacterized protein n=1 Tax=Trichonephila clavipes TaxID=2585209 RepID=A0A8X6SWH2_TRICX|nr:hypothetical protein TNCV_1283271 [Trichonephila clavipes]
MDSIKVTHCQQYSFELIVSFYDENLKNVSPTKEVAVVIIGQEFKKRDIVLSCRGGTLMRITETHRACDVLQYLLMFFHGEDGYQINILKCHEMTKIPLSKTLCPLPNFTATEL